MSPVRFFGLFGFALLLSGCASYSIKPISADVAKWPEGDTKGKNGYVFYQPELYFAATITTAPTAGQPGKQDVSVNVAPIYLPNYRKPYRVKTQNFLAKADFSFEFENGWKLLKLSDKSDNSTVATALAGELKTMLSAAGLPVKGGVEKAKTRVLLFRPEFDHETGYFLRFKSAGEIILPQ